uniref:Virion infectivity factor n=1 Tax=Human immunodeficiency virus type 1 TaxID=11676 RepID=G8I1F7_HV1|nr:vif protein [Human immunodeficiency virus 1]
MENRWQVMIVWQVDRMRIRTGKSLVKHHMHISRRAQGWFYRHHYESTHPRVSSEVHIPLGDNGRLVITTYWGPAHRKKKRAFGSRELFQKEEKEDLPPSWTLPYQTNKFICYNFDCFSDFAIRNAILGHIVYPRCEYQAGHNKVGSLQYLALTALIKPKKTKPPLPSVKKLTEDRWNKPQKTKGHRGSHTMSGH